jgi:hypothetical protein
VNNWPDSVNNWPDSVNNWPDSANNWPDSVNNWPDSVNNWPDSVNNWHTKLPPEYRQHPAMHLRARQRGRGALDFCSRIMTAVRNRIQVAYTSALQFSRADIPCLSELQRTIRHKSGELSFKGGDANRSLSVGKASPKSPEGSEP